jgi:hypothetical protein
MRILSRVLPVLLAGAAWGAEPAPLLVLLGPAAEPWQAVAAQRGWDLVALGEAAPTDLTVQRIADAVAQAAKGRVIDPDRTYVAGLGASAAAAFYAVSRRPDLWTGALAAGDDIDPAIETNRLFGTNAQLIPILWLVSPQAQDAAQAVLVKLRAKGFDVELRTATTTVEQAFDWLAGHKRFPYPPKIDCETGAPAFARCYWLEITKFDPAARNDVLLSSRVPPGPGAYLAFGPFGYDKNADGPGVLVGWLPPNYSGPLELGDRILSVGGTSLADAHAYIRYMAGQRDERGIGVIIERGKKRERLETRIALAQRGESFTGRVKAEYLQDAHELLVITRGVAGLRLDLPSFWVPCTINWNGNDAGSASAAGCWLLSAGFPAEPCR